MKRVLSVCGGGIFGLLPALWLTAIEAKTGQAIADLFDLVAGTSTGGIIASGLAARVPASQLAALYRDHGAEIFHSSFGQTIGDLWGLTGPKYSAGPLEALLAAVLGDKTLANVATPLLVPASRCMPTIDAWLFRSWSGPNFALRDVARATSAAPYYFPPADVLAGDGEVMTFVDGGLWANDPEDAAVLEARALWPGEDISVLSLGTGYEPVSVPAGVDWGAADWLPHVVDVVLGCGEAGAAQRAKLLATNRIRLDAPIGGDMDDVSSANMAAMTAAAEAVISGPAFAAVLDQLGAKVAA